jgi:hypothetical protein
VGNSKNGGLGEEAHAFVDMLTSEPTAVQAAVCCKRAGTQYDPYDGHRTYV